MKKILISVLMLCSMIGLTFAQDSNQDVVSWLYSNGLTKYESTNSFRPYDSITRGEAAKFMVEYAQMQNMTKIKSAQECQFADIINYDSSLRPYIIQACEYGIFKGSNGKYFPNNNITKGEAIAVVMRTRYGVLEETSYVPRYGNYYHKAETLQLTLGNINGFDRSITRIDLGRWLKETKQTTTIDGIIQMMNQKGLEQLSINDDSISSISIYPSSIKNITYHIITRPLQMGSRIWHGTYIDIYINDNTTNKKHLLKTAYAGHDQYQSNDVTTTEHRSAIILGIESNKLIFAPIPSGVGFGPCNNVWLYDELLYTDLTSSSTDTNPYTLTAQKRLEYEKAKLQCELQL